MLIKLLLHKLANVFRQQLHQKVIDRQSGQCQIIRLDLNNNKLRQEKSRYGLLSTLRQQNIYPERLAAAALIMDDTAIDMQMPLCGRQAVMQFASKCN